MPLSSSFTIAMRRIALASAIIVGTSPCLFADQVQEHPLEETITDKITSKEDVPSDIEEINAERSETVPEDDSNLEISDLTLGAKEEPEMSPQEVVQNKPTIRTIYLVRKNRNKFLTDAAIRKRIPYKVGETFTPLKTNALIKKLHKLDYFSQIKVKGTPLPNNQIDLYVVLDEQDDLFDIVINGNTHVTLAEIESATKMSDMPALDDRKLKWIVKKIAETYAKKNYHGITVDSRLEKKDGQVTAHIDICENAPSYVKRVFIKGNKCVSDKRLKENLKTREDWLLSFINKDGSYQKENLEVDKHILETVYKMKGFVTAKTTGVTVDEDPETHDFNVTFNVEEGDQYCVGKVSANGHDILREEYLLANIPICEGSIYNQREIIDAIEALKDIWGRFGYIFADVQPNIEPNEDTKTLDIHFDVDLGSRVHLRRLDIRGNKKTRDYVIRRRLSSLREGDLLTKNKMDRAKNMVEGLSYFAQPDGVLWKINRVNDDAADLELVVKEKKTGKVAAWAGFGGAQAGAQGRNPSMGLSTGASITEGNLLGYGLTTNLSLEWSKEQWSLTANAINPYFRDKPIYLEGTFNYNRTDWTQELPNVQNFLEYNVGSGITTGYVVTAWEDMVMRVMTGFNYITYNHDPQVKPVPVTASSNLKSINEGFQSIVNNVFPQATVLWVAPGISQNLKNNAMHPTKGFQWTIDTRIGWSASDTRFGFFKAEADFSWFTPLIGEQDLIFGFHAHAGRVFSISGRQIPFKEVFHIGGPLTVRGFDFGSISPTYSIDGHPNDIGAKKSFYINAELIFPITRDFSMKGCVFYDGGAGWDAPATDCLTALQRTAISRNNFNYRHSVGVGLRMLQPTPMRIDIGFKLDKLKREKEFEVHISGYSEF